MYELEIWLDVVLGGDGGDESVCTLVGNPRVPIRPLRGEQIQFVPVEGSEVGFQLMSPKGPVFHTSVNVTVDEVNHYIVRHNNKWLIKTALHCSAISVVSKDDARTIYHFLTTQLGFGVDRYAINSLE